MKELELKIDLSTKVKADHWNMHEPVANFHGRQQILQTLHDHLQQPSVVALTGMGGVGKTQIAAMFVKSHQNEYTKICWISGSNLTKSLAEFLYSMGQNLPPDPSIEMLSQMIVRTFCGTQERVLFVLDDVTLDGRKEVNAFKRISQGRLSLLLTSQTSDWEGSGVALVKVPCFEEGEAIKFLQKQLKTTSADADHLATCLQSLPLALQQAVCYIKRFKTPVTTYIDQFEACRQSILNTKIDSFSEYDKTLLTVWNIAFDKIKTESINALLVLGMMAYMDNRFINPKTFLHCPDIADEMELNEIVELLCQYSLVMRRERDDCLEIHALVQKIIQIHNHNQRNSFADGLDLKGKLESILILLSSAVDTDDIRYKDNENLWFVHFIKLMEIPDNLMFYQKFDARLMTNIARRKRDQRCLFSICMRYLPFLFGKYRLTKDFDDFILFIDISRMLLSLSTPASGSSAELSNRTAYYEPNIVFMKVWLLYWKCQYHDALKLFDEFENNRGYNVFFIQKPLLLLKLGKLDGFVYDNDCLFGILTYYVSLSYIKFMRHDLSGSKELLRDWNEDEGMKQILDWVSVYEIKLNEFQEKKNSSLSNYDIIKSLRDCLEMKKMVIKLYDAFLLARFQITVTPL